jgi:hypothetical protein
MESTNSVLSLGSKKINQRMHSIKLYALLYAFKILTCSCQPERQHQGFEEQTSGFIIEKRGKLSEKLNENSGLETYKDTPYLITHNDGGGEAELYVIDNEGTIKETLPLLNAKNKDWEDITQDNKGTIFVGDFGNNNMKRQDLVVYKTNGSTSEKIRFRYENQEDFPAKKPIFDCEAFFWFNDSLYLFTKSRFKKKQETTLYVLPDKAGDYVLSPQETFETELPVTAADSSPDQTEFALLTYGKVLFFGISNGKINFSLPKRCIKVGKKQVEALTYISNNELLFSNEQGTLYSLKW